MNNSVAVIGRGIAGLCCAYRFAQAGFGVTVFGKPASAAGATRVATGMSTIKGNRIAEQPLFRLKVRGHLQLKKLLRELEEQSQKRLVYDGVSEPFQSLLEYQSISEKVFRRQFRGLFRTRIIAESRWRGPALFYPDDFFFDPLVLAATLESVLMTLGAEFKEQQINNISPGTHTGYLNLGTAASSPALGEYKEVILAAGDASQELLASAGFSVQPLSKVWGETVVSSFQGDPASACPVGVTKLGASGVGLSGLARTGSSSLLLADVTEDRQRLARAKLMAQHRDFFGETSASVRFESGIRLRHQSRWPLVGQLWLDPAGNSRLRVATAFYKNGFQFADLAACLHVSQVLNPQYTSDLFPTASQPLQILT